MPIVTITSDFGLKDYYLAVMKGALLGKNDQLNIVDITHNIKHYDIVQAAFVLRNAYKSFPKGTIHLLSVNNYYSKKNCYLALRYDGHYFVGPDNGVFSLLIDGKAEAIYELEYQLRSHFSIKELYAKAVAHLASGRPINEIGIPLDQISERISFQPVITPNRIQGSVIHIDHYENVVLNISQKLFNQVRNKRPFLLYYKRNNPIRKLSRNYHDVPIGEPLCLFNSADFLEIAINTGKAGSLLGLQLEDTVQIDFKKS